MNKKIRILVVDDNRKDRLDLMNIVADLGWVNVFGAKDGEEAYQKYLAEKYNLIFADAIMPGIDGISLIKRLGPMANVIIITGLQDALAGQAMILGAKGIIQKPFQKDQIKNEIEKIASSIEV